MNIIITTSHSMQGHPYLTGFIKDSGLTFIPRQGKGLATLKKENGADGVVVWKPPGPVLYLNNEEFFFHPNMAKTRIGNIRKLGGGDPLITAGDLKPGDKFLDCTLGLGADAIVAAYFTGMGVTGLESSRLVAAMVRWGMKMYQSGMGWLDEPIHRIQVIHTDHHDYLEKMADKSYDVVYFDPMFRHPVFKSQALSPLRLLANPQPLNRSTLEAARRVARKRVVIKETIDSGEFQRLQVDDIVLKAHHRIAYGIIFV